MDHVIPMQLGNHTFLEIHSMGKIFYFKELIIFRCRAVTSLEVSKRIGCGSSDLQLSPVGSEKMSWVDEKVAVWLLFVCTSS